MASVSALEHTGIGALAGVVEVCIMQVRPRRLRDAPRVPCHRCRRCRRRQRAAGHKSSGPNCAPAVPRPCPAADGGHQERAAGGAASAAHAAGALPRPRGELGRESGMQALDEAAAAMQSCKPVVHAAAAIGAHPHAWLPLPGQQGPAGRHAPGAGAAACGPHPPAPCPAPLFCRQVSAGAMLPITAVQFGMNRALEQTYRRVLGTAPTAKLSPGGTVAVALGAGASSAFLGCPAE